MAQTTNPAPAAPKPAQPGERVILLNRIAYHVIGLLPLAWLLFDYWLGRLGPDPVRAIILRTGKSAIILLVLSLACTPLFILLGNKLIMRWRRPMGLYSFMYVCLHLLAFVWLDYGFMWGLILQELTVRRFALVGFLAFLLLIPLAITSTRPMQQRLGWDRWHKLHKLVYLIAVLALIHFAWLTKNDYTEPILFAAIVAVLFAIRLPVVKQAIMRLRSGAAG